MDLGIADARFFIQGGTTGAGLAIAELLAGAEARLLVTGRSAGSELAVHLRSLGSPEVLVAAMDVSRPEEIQRVCSGIGRSWSELNGLVNVAGPAVVRTVWSEIDDDRWAMAFAAGPIGAVRVCRAVLPLLRTADWARIVNVSALSARVQTPGIADYSASKAALNSVTKSLSIELAPDRILVNAVSPGSIMSDRLRRELTERGLDPMDATAAMAIVRERHVVRCDLDRVAMPADVARVVAFLISRANTHVTGANLPVDGGSPVSI